MSDLDPTYAAALDKPVVTEFFAVEMTTVDGVVRLLDGAGVATFLGRTFHGVHAVFGTLGGIDGLEDAADTQVAEVTLRLLPPSTTAAVDLASPANQGGALAIWRGALDPATGLVIGEPKLEFAGELDVPTLSGDRNLRVLSFTATAQTDRLFDDDESVRLSDSFHRTLYPDDPSLEFVTGLGDQMPWGVEAKLPASVRRVTSVTEPTPADFNF